MCRNKRRELRIRSWELKGQGASKPGSTHYAKPTEFVPKPSLACVTFFVTLENTRNFGV